MNQPLLPFPQSIFTFLFLVLCSYPLAAQEYLGFGVHFAPPIRIDNCCNSYVEAKPILVPAYSFTFRKMWENKKGKNRYYEAGFTTMAIGAKVKHYPNDSLNTWNYLNMTHVGFPAILFGGGRVFSLKGRSLNQDISLGLEGSFVFAHDLGGYSSYIFGLNNSGEYITFPFYLRINAGYGVQAKLFRNIPIYLQAYTNLSFQDVVNGSHYIMDPVTGNINEDGRYRLNNSEIGIKIFANTDVNYNNTKWVKRVRGQKGPFIYRVSMETQSYMPPATEYWTPRVDSFSLTGFRYAFTHQAGLKTEFPHPRNNRWATVMGVGFGMTYVTTQFKALSSFTQTGNEIDSAPHGSSIGIHIIPNLGIAYKHPLGNKHIQHTVSTTLVVPLGKESSGTFVTDGDIDPSLPPHLWPSILRTEIDYKYGRSKALFGFEYQPELLVHADKRFFYGIGLVFNYSWGVTAHGLATVDNGRTQYYGAIFQRFSKIGVSLRMGWNSSPRN